MSRRSFLQGWAGPSGPIGTYISEDTKKTLEAYHVQPDLILEHANHEEDTARGGYAHRQLFELVQNSADALAGSNGGRICIRLTSKYLYCADEGKPVDEAGVRALKSSHMSSKRGTAEIGRFGLGFKSVIGVTDCPEFFSRSGSFKFDRDESIRLIRAVVSSSERYPILRLPVAVDPARAVEDDPVLHEFMSWATNIVRLPLRPGSNEDLRRQITAFPQEFLLFVNHVSQLTMEMGGQVVRTFNLNRQGEISVLKDGENESQWLVVSDEHRLSEEAKSDRRSLDDVDNIQVSWAIPVNRLDSTGHFWAFFPTMTTSPLAGILNAPWKTNEDRQNLLTGVYNDELIDFAAGLAAKTITKLQTKADPARHLDALPRRSEPGDPEHFSRLRSELYRQLQDYELAPGQKGDLIHVRDALYPPKELTDSIDMDLFESWATYRYLPDKWLHVRALTRRRLARLDSLYLSYLKNHMQQSPSSSTSIPRQSIAKWLEAITFHAKSIERRGEPNWQELAIEASTAAIQTAVLIDARIRNRHDKLGSIIFTSQGKWVIPDPNKVFLSESTSFHHDAETTHPHLYGDPKTLQSLKQLGLQYLSPEVALKALISEVKYYIQDWDNDDWSNLWGKIRAVNQSTAVELITSNLNDYSQWSRRGWHDLLHVQTIAGSWSPLSKTLFPGGVVPKDGSRDGDIAIDLKFHAIDVNLLQKLGATDTSTTNYPLSSDRYFSFLRSCRRRFIQKVGEDPNINGTPQEKKLEFIRWEAHTTSGPLDVFELLSEEGKLLYTKDLLDVPDTYDQWMMEHETRKIYGTQYFESPAVEALLEYGRIRTERGISNLSEGLSPNPDSLVVKELLRHRNADQIVKTFDLCVETQIAVEAIGEDESIPLIDIWPGFRPYLSDQQMDLRVVRCDELLQFGTGTDDLRLDCTLRDSTIYVVRQNEEEELQHILEELEIELEIFASIRDILEYKTPEEVERARALIRECATDEERLLAAVGETALQERLPWGLLEIMEQDQGNLTGVQIAQAAIATFHTGALREYRHDLDHLGPPGQWAGSPKAVRFVQSLGFGEDWAGSKIQKRFPYVEVVGPYSLPPLHDFQCIIVDNVKNLIRSRKDQGEGRGMISMPTGSGKTRVAVQAIVEAIREGQLKGNILWIADRDELCEQAVEAWTQVWSSEGSKATRLRISRMWGGQPTPLPTEDIHVVVASVQTIYSRIADRRATLEFLTDLKLLVFDEAHRSVTHSHTTVMKELGLDRRRRSDEPILIGLTATPYRGHNQQETARLVNRYGKNRLDAGAFSSDDPEKVVQELQTMDVLAKADHAIIEGGRFRLSHEELQESEKAPWLPRSVENRIAEDADRTRRIVQAYLDRTGRSWPTLIYATSVEHSQVIAALLVTKGIEARAVSANTDTRTRRRTVEGFRNGEIAVLVNYGIFREGFDAPKTRAVIIARPVYSPNLYFQMIGRGLRGVKNGGNDRCLILDVNDNVVNFQKKLAFSDLDWLWDWTPSG